MGFTDNTVGRDIVQPGDAIVDSTGRIRVVKTTNTKPRIVMESHYTWRLGGGVGVGPAMFLQAAGGDSQGLFDAAGGGVLFELGPQGATSFNIIVGGLVDFAVSRMHSAYTDGELFPTDEILYIEETDLSLFFGFVVGLK